MPMGLKSLSGGPENQGNVFSTKTVKRHDPKSALPGQPVFIVRINGNLTTVILLELVQFYE